MENDKATSLPGTPPPRILLVEDNPIQARVLNALVMRMGLQPVGPAATALEALELCRQELPALAVLDIELPGEFDGIDLAAHLQELGPIPLVFLSASHDGAALQRMLPLHPLAFLPKPYRPSMLQRLISDALQQSAAQLPPPVPGLIPNQVTPNEFFIRENNALVRLNTSDIISVQAIQQYSVLVLQSGRRHSVRLTLAELLSRLPAAHFVQCHRAWLINTRCIEQVALSSNLLRLLDGTEAPVGRSYRHNIQQHLRILG